MSDVLVNAEALSKKFCRDFRKSLWYGAQEFGRQLLGLNRPREVPLRADEFWAVRDVSFSVKRGECLAVIGHNGAGKTTLLRILNGLISPSEGRVEMRGRIGALIALGAGFHPLLTGRENIFINGSILGLSRSETKRRFDQIVEFSGLAEHLDSPVQQYSSGMYVRLGFAIAAHTDPDLLLVDEALAVGDHAFMVRCLNRIAALKREGAGIIFVSHQEIQVREVADRCLVMSKGEVICDSDLDEGFSTYEHSRDQHPTSAGPDGGDFAHNGAITIEECQLTSTDDNDAFRTGAPVRMTLSCNASENIANAELLLRFWTLSGQLVTSVSSVAQNDSLDIRQGHFRVTVDLPRLMLAPGIYRIAGGFRRRGEILSWRRQLARLQLAPPSNFQLSDGLIVTHAKIRLFKPDGLVT